MKLCSDNFDFSKAVRVVVPESWKNTIKEIWFEFYEQMDYWREYDLFKDNMIDLADAGLALIVFHNNEKLLISNSEWCTLMFFNNLSDEIKKL